LRDGIHLTREEIVSEFKKARIDVTDNRASHILMRAELDGIICGGRQKGVKPRYTLLAEWVKNNKKTYRDEALRELARRYFTSHGPATIQDFTWWSGLSSSDSKLALELSKDQLISEIIENNAYWFAGSLKNSEFRSGEIFFLPSYDEFVISYRDRSASLPLTDNKFMISDNGIFYPIIVVNGKIAGIWKRNIKKDKVIIETRLFISGGKGSGGQFKKALDKYSTFINRKIEFISPQ
jgi:hypothetical protein